MATQVNPKATKTRTKSAQSAKIKDYVDRQVEKTRRQVKTTDLIAGLIGLVVLVIGFFLAAALIDGWIWTFTNTARLVGLCALIALIAIYSLVYIVPLLFRRINPEYAAKMIEDSTPTFKNSLLNYLRLGKKPKEVKSAVYDAVGRQAATHLSKAPSDSTVDRSVLIRTGLVLVAVVIAAIGYKVLSPKDPMQTVYRLLWPGSKISKPAVVQILDVEPGDTQVFFGDQLNVTARVRGKHESSDVRILFSTDDGQRIDVPIVMTGDDSGMRYSGIISTGSSGIQQSLKYKVVARDGISPEYRVAVRTNPTIAVKKVDIVPPKYTRLPSRTIEGRGDIEAPEDSLATVHATANMPIKSAYLELLRETNDEDNPYRVLGQPKEMEVQDRQASTRVQVSMNDQRTAPRYSHYRIRFESKDGARNKTPNVYPIRVTPDLAPEITIVNPKSPAATAENRKMAIDIEANDLDYEISKIEIRLNQAGRTLVPEVSRLKLKKDENGQFVTARYYFDPSWFGLKQGDTVSFKALATDNRVHSGRAAGNQTLSEELKIVINPVEEGKDPNEKKKNEEPQEKNNSEDPKEKNSDSADSAENEQDQKNENGSDSDDQETGDEGEDGEQENDTDDGEDQESDAGEDSEEKGDEGDQTGERESSETGTEQEAGNEDDGAREDGSEDGSDNKSDGGEGSETPNEQSDGSEDNQPAESEKQDDGGGSEDNSVGETGADGAQSESPETSDDAGNGGSQDGTGEEDLGDNGSGGGEESDGSSEHQSGEGGENESDGTADGDGRRDASLSEGEEEPLDENASEGEQVEKLKEYFDKEQKAGGQKSGNAGDPSNPEQESSGEPAASDQGERTDEPSQGKGDGEIEDSDPNSKSDPNSESSTDPNSDSKLKESADSKEQQSEDSEQNNPERQPEGAEGGNESSKGGGGESGPPEDSDASEEKSGGGGGAESQDSGEESSDSGSGGGAGGSEGNDEKKDKKDDNAEKGDQGDQGDRGDRESEKQDSPEGGGEGEDGGDDQSSGESASGDGGAEAAAGQGAPNPSGESTQGNGQASGSAVSSAASSTKAAAQSGGVDLGKQKENIEHAKKATDLILNRLREQQYNPDPKLLEQMNWSADDLRRFVKRWEQLKAESKSNDKGKQDYLNALESLGTSPRTPESRRIRRDNLDQLHGLSEDSAVSRPPAKFEDKFKSFLRERNRAKKRTRQK